MSGERNSSNVSLSSSNYNPDVAAAAEAQREQLLLLTSPPRQTAGPLQETTALHSALPARQLHYEFDPQQHQHAQQLQAGQAQLVPGQQTLQPQLQNPAGSFLPPRRSTRPNLGQAPDRLGWETGAAAHSAAPGQPALPPAPGGSFPLPGVGRGRGQPHPLARDTIRPGPGILPGQPPGGPGLGHPAQDGVAGQFASLGDQQANLREQLLQIGENAAGLGTGTGRAAGLADQQAALAARQDALQHARQHLVAGDLRGGQPAPLQDEFAPELGTLHNRVETGRGSNSSPAGTFRPVVSSTARNTPAGDLVGGAGGGAAGPAPGTGGPTPAAPGLAGPALSGVPPAQVVTAVTQGGATPTHPSPRGTPGLSQPPPGSGRIIGHLTPTALGPAIQNPSVPGDAGLEQGNSGRQPAAPAMLDGGRVRGGLGVQQVGQEGGNGDGAAQQPDPPDPDPPPPEGLDQGIKKNLYKEVMRSAPRIMSALPAADRRYKVQWLRLGQQQGQGQPTSHDQWLETNLPSLPAANRGWLAGSYQGFCNLLRLARESMDPDNPDHLTQTELDELRDAMIVAHPVALLDWIATTADGTQEQLCLANLELLERLGEAALYLLTKRDLGKDFMAAYATYTASTRNLELAAFQLCNGSTSYDVASQYVVRHFEFMRTLLAKLNAFGVYSITDQISANCPGLSRITAAAQGEVALMVWNVVKQRGNRAVIDIGEDARNDVFNNMHFNRPHQFCVTGVGQANWEIDQQFIRQINDWRVEDERARREAAAERERRLSAAHVPPARQDHGQRHRHDSGGDAAARNEEKRLQGRALVAEILDFQLGIVGPVPGMQHTIPYLGSILDNAAAIKARRNQCKDLLDSVKHAKNKFIPLPLLADLCHLPAGSVSRPASDILRELEEKITAAETNEKLARESLNRAEMSELNSVGDVFNFYRDFLNVATKFRSEAERKSEVRKKIKNKVVYNLIKDLDTSNQILSYIANMYVNETTARQFLIDPLLAMPIPQTISQMVKNLEKMQNLFINILHYGFVSQISEPNLRTLEHRVFTVAYSIPYRQAAELHLQGLGIVRNAPLDFTLGSNFMASIGQNLDPAHTRIEIDFLLEYTKQNMRGFYIAAQQEKTLQSENKSNPRGGTGGGGHYRGGGGGGGGRAANHDNTAGDRSFRSSHELFMENCHACPETGPDAHKTKWGSASFCEKVQLAPLKSRLETVKKKALCSTCLRRKKACLARGATCAVKFCSLCRSTTHQRILCPEYAGPASSRNYHADSGEPDEDGDPDGDGEGEKGDGEAYRNFFANLDQHCREEGESHGSGDESPAEPQSDAPAAGAGEAVQPGQDDAVPRLDRQAEAGRGEAGPAAAPPAQHDTKPAPIPLSAGDCTTFVNKLFYTEAGVEIKLGTETGHGSNCFRNSTFGECDLATTKQQLEYLYSKAGRKEAAGALPQPGGKEQQAEEGRQLERPGLVAQEAAGHQGEEEEEEAAVPPQAGGAGQDLEPGVAAHHLEALPGGAGEAELAAPGHLLLEAEPELQVPAPVDGGEALDGEGAPDQPGPVSPKLVKVNRLENSTAFTSILNDAVLLYNLFGFIRGVTISAYLALPPNHSVPAKYADRVEKHPAMGVEVFRTHILLDTGNDSLCAVKSVLAASGAEQIGAKNSSITTLHGTKKLRQSVHLLRFVLPDSAPYVTHGGSVSSIGVERRCPAELQLMIAQLVGLDVAQLDFTGGEIEVLASLRESRMLARPVDALALPHSPNLLISKSLLTDKLFVSGFLGIEEKVVSKDFPAEFYVEPELLRPGFGLNKLTGDLPTDMMLMGKEYTAHRTLLTSADCDSIMKRVKLTMEEKIAPPLCSGHSTITSGCQACQNLLDPHSVTRSLELAAIKENMRAVPVDGEEDKYYMEFSLIFSKDPQSWAQPCHSNEKAAAATSKRLWKKASLNREHLENIDGQIKEAISEGFYREVKQPELDEVRQGLHSFTYLDVVYNEKSQSTSCRLINNSQARLASGDTMSGLQCRGSNLLASLKAAFLRFMVFPFQFSSDISRCYRRMKVTRLSSLLRMKVWWSNALEAKTCDELIPIILAVVVLDYGDPICSAALELTFSEFVTLSKFVTSQYTKTALLRARFVDNILGSAPTAEDANLAIQEIPKACEQYSLKIKYVLFTPEVNELKAAELTASGCDFKDSFFCCDMDFANSKISPNFCLNYFGTKRGKSLGPHLVDMKRSDMVSMTRKQLLRLSMEIFDGSGRFLAPLIANAKLLGRDICMLKTGWDDDLSLVDRPLHDKAADFYYDMARYRDSLIPYDSFMIPPGYVPVSLIAAHDSGVALMAVAIYLVSKKAGSSDIKDTHCSIVTASSRLHKWSIPQAEAASIPYAAGLLHETLQQLPELWENKELTVFLQGDAKYIVTLFEECKRLKVTDTCIRNAVVKACERGEQISLQFHSTCYLLWERGSNTEGFQLNPSDLCSKWQDNAITTANSDLWRSGPKHFRDLAYMKSKAYLKCENGKAIYLEPPVDSLSPPGGQLQIKKSNSNSDSDNLQDFTDTSSLIYGLNSFQTSTPCWECTASVHTYHSHLLDSTHCRTDPDSCTSRAPHLHVSADCVNAARAMWQQERNLAVFTRARQKELDLLLRDELAGSNLAECADPDTAATVVSRSVSRAKTKARARELQRLLPPQQPVVAQGEQADLEDEQQQQADQASAASPDLPSTTPVHTEDVEVKSTMKDLTTFLDRVLGKKLGPEKPLVTACLSGTEVLCQHLVSPSTYQAMLHSSHSFRHIVRKMVRQVKFMLDSYRPDVLQSPELLLQEAWVMLVKVSQAQYPVRPDHTSKLEAGMLIFTPHVTEDGAKFLYGGSRMPVISKEDPLAAYRLYDLHRHYCSELRRFIHIPAATTLSRLRQGEFAMRVDGAAHVLNKVTFACSGCNLANRHKVEVRAAPMYKPELLSYLPPPSSLVSIDMLGWIQVKVNDNDIKTTKVYPLIIVDNVYSIVNIEVMYDSKTSAVCQALLNHQLKHGKILCVVSDMGSNLSPANLQPALDNHELLKDSIAYNFEAKSQYKSRCERSVQSAKKLIAAALNSPKGSRLKTLRLNTLHLLLNYVSNALNQIPMAKEGFDYLCPAMFTPAGTGMMVPASDTKFGTLDHALRHLRERMGHFRMQLVAKMARDTKADFPARFERGWQVKAGDLVCFDADGHLQYGCVEKVSATSPKVRLRVKESTGNGNYKSVTKDAAMRHLTLIIPGAASLSALNPWNDPLPLPLPLHNTDENLPKACQWLQTVPVKAVAPVLDTSYLNTAPYKTFYLRSTRISKGKGKLGAEPHHLKTNFRLDRLDNVQHFNLFHSCLIKK